MNQLYVTKVTGLIFSIHAIIGGGSSEALWSLDWDDQVTKSTSGSWGRLQTLV